MDVFLTVVPVRRLLRARGPGGRGPHRPRPGAQRLLPPRRVEAAGATAVRGDLTDADLLAREATAAEGTIHTASPGDATSADVDAAFLDAVLGAIGGSGKPYVHTGGCLGARLGHVDEDTPRDAP